MVPITGAMRILSANIELSSAHHFEARSRVREQVDVRPLPAPADGTYHTTRSDQSRDVAKLTKLLQRYFDNRPDDDKPEKIAEKIDQLVKQIEARLKAAGPQPTPGPAAEVRYRREERYQERETVSFRAAGSVTTTDGRQIDFQQALDLARVYARRETVTFGAVGAPGQGSPPATPATTTRSALAVAGGVVGLDADRDGKIDPATELIGGTGNGFAELAQFDDDHNGFIDEGDQIFSRLAVVRPGDEGSSATSFASAGVGALFLGSVSTPFTQRDASGEVSGAYARSGVYLNENGTTGVAHQVDLVI